MQKGQGEELIITTNAPIDRLLNAAHDATPVSGLTHTFYRYPARFSPRFVRTAIELFTEPGDLVLDPFMGGGTTLVEAVALGRQGLGTDISPLAAFVSRAKTTLLADNEIVALTAWAARAQAAIHMHHPSPEEPKWGEGQDYKKHLRQRSTWRLRKAIEQSIASTSGLTCPRLERFARCAILRTAQWALDSRKQLPSIPAFRKHLVENFEQMIVGAVALREEATSGEREPSRIRCLNRSAVDLDSDPTIAASPPPRLVLTSPPYPGVHVLYHRWQVDGRKETPAPFWIARMLDGSGGSYYTMGDRKERELTTYYHTLAAIFRSVARLCDERTTIVQMVAFAAPEWQLPRYLEVMQDAGFQESPLTNHPGALDCRLWREVPNRRWHADQKGTTPGSREVMLVHKLAAVSTRPRRQSRIDSPLPRPAH